MRKLDGMRMAILEEMGWRGLIVVGGRVIQSAYI